MKKNRLEQIAADIRNAPEWPINEPLMPTHSCFDDALAFVPEVMNPELLREVEHRCAIVHGLLRVGGELTAHGWFECDAAALFTIRTEPHENPNPRVVWQAGLARNPVAGGEPRRMYYACEAEPFYRYVEQYSRYTLRLAARLTKLNESSGPWRREYRELARHGDAAAHGVRGKLEMQKLVCVIDPVAFEARFPVPVKP